MVEEKLLLMHLKVTPSGFDYNEDEIPRMSPDEDELSKQHDELYKEISNVDNKLDSELITKYFRKGSLLGLFEYLKPSNNKIINTSTETLIRANLLNLKNGIRDMSDDEIKNKNLDLIVYFVEKILYFVEKIYIIKINNQTLQICQN